MLDKILEVLFQIMMIVTMSLMSVLAGGLLVAIISHWLS